MYSQPLMAQMFSVEEDERTEFAPLPNYTVAGLSWEIAEFEFVGEGLSESETADFNNSILRFRFESSGVHISIGFGGSLTGMDDASYINLNAKLFQDLNIVRSNRFLLSIPIQIVSDLIGVQKESTNAEFRQNGFVFGTGIASRINLAERVNLSLRGTPNYGFSFAQGPDDGGSLFTATSKVRLNFAQVLGDYALTFGYDFDYRNYNLEGTENDYRYSSHAFTIGIGF